MNIDKINLTGFKKKLLDDLFCGQMNTGRVILLTLSMLRQLLVTSMIPVEKFSNILWPPLTRVPESR